MWKYVSNSQYLFKQTCMAYIYLIFLIQYAFTVNGNISDYYLVLFVVNSNEINICHLQNYYLLDR